MKAQDQVTQEMAGAIARYWSGGNGPTHSALTASFALADYVESDEVGNKQDRVLKSLRQGDPDSRTQIAEELINLLRNSGELDGGEDQPKLKGLRTAFHRAGHDLTDDGYIDWNIGNEKHSPKPPSQTAPGTRQPVAQRKVLQAILDAFRQYRIWPTAAFIESQMLGVGIELHQTLGALPFGWFFPDTRSLGGVLRLQPNEKIGLSILGVARCEESGPIIPLFMKGLQWGVHERLKFRPSPIEYVEPKWTFNDFLVGISEPNKPPLLNDVVLTLELMRNEPFLPRWSGPIDNVYGWVIEIPNEIKRLVHLQTIDDYVQHREDEVALPISGARIQRNQIDESDRQEMTTATVFVVHGHDEARKHEVARVLAKLTLREPVILHEKPNQGQTIIEKFEKHARTAAFAVVLLTADDLGGSKRIPDRLGPRARQNVVFELGYFIGALGRDRVVALYERGVELPSDLNGLLYTEIDSQGAWRAELARELRAAGINVDADGLM